MRASAACPAAFALGALAARLLLGRRGRPAPPSERNYYEEMRTFGEADPPPSRANGCGRPARGVG